LAHPQQQIYLDLFKRVVKHYFKSFARAYEAYYGLGTGSYPTDLLKYKQVINDTSDNVYIYAAHQINTYVNLYKIAIKSPDEYKAIYHIGRGIENQLVGVGLKDIAKVHLFAMVGLLDDRLQTPTKMKPNIINKPALTLALTNLIRQDSLEAELGKNGCYMIYKCVSTTPKATTPGPKA